MKKQAVAFLLIIAICCGLFSITAFGAETVLEKAIITKDESHTVLDKNGNKLSLGSGTAMPLVGQYNESGELDRLDSFEIYLGSSGDTVEADSYTSLRTSYQTCVEKNWVLYISNSKGNYLLILQDECHHKDYEQDYENNNEAGHKSKCSNCLFASGENVAHTAATYEWDKENPKKHKGKCACGYDIVEDHTHLSDGYCEAKGCTYAEDFELILDPNDGTETKKVSGIKCGDVLPEQEKLADKADATFGGWYTDKDGKTPYTFGKDKLSLTQSPMTLYAKWNPKSTDPENPSKPIDVPTETTKPDSSVNEDNYNNATTAEKTAMDEAKNAASKATANIEDLFDAKESNGNVTIAGKEIPKATIDKVKDDLATEAGVEVSTLKTVVVPRLGIVVSAAKVDEKGNTTAITFDITASAELRVVTADGSKYKIVDTVSLNDTKEEVVITLPLENNFYNSLGRYPMVRHEKGDNIYKHKAVKADGKITFRNRHGFSKFTVMNSDAVALTGEYYYDSLEEAIANVENNGTIDVLEKGKGASVEVSREITFTLTGDGADSAKITAGNGYEVTKNGNTYTVTRTGSTGGSGGSGGGSSKPSIKPGTTTTPTDPITNPGDQTGTGTVAGFSDVSASAWYADAVKYVVDRGLFGGVGNGRFAPDANMTRAMMWTVLARYKGVDTNTGSNWYEAARTWAMQQNISDGTMADGNVTREQFVTMLWRLSGEPAANNSASFTDNGRVSAYAKTAVDWAVAQGIVNGYNDGSFRPQGSATRAEVAKMLMVFCVTSEG